MADDGDRSALTLLWTVSLCILVVFLMVSAVAVDGTDGGSIGFGLGGLFVGGLLATVWQLRKQRKSREPGRSEFAGLLDRMQLLEQEQQRMAELEERVDFAERMLARAQDEALLPNMRHDGRGA
ncbi:MAG TPA: hypothetical protein VFO96_10785 [Gemmatimonadales bacterium]|jgi:hypothetical protein|nr:hypothetical protein [Gemmatimonadales bacterium]